MLTYDAGPFNVPNQTPAGAGQVDTGPRCDGQFPCDNFALTVSLPAGYLAQNPNASVKVTLSWTNTTPVASDYDLYIYNGVVGNLNGSIQADYSSASAANPEVTSIIPLADGTRQYSVKIVPFQPAQETVHVRLEFSSGSGAGGGFPGFGGPDPTTPGVPRYQNFFAPAGTSASPGQGESNIGFNPATGRIMTMNFGPIWRLTPGERLTPIKPECCEALWEDKSAETLDTPAALDPILWTDQKTGRTFGSNSTVGNNAQYAYSDNDGDLWVQASVAPPNPSSDHQTIGSGPYPASLSVLSNPVNKGQAVYYCAQTYPLGGAACQRSDTLGASYGPGIFTYNRNTDLCGGIHGHLHVAPDGTVYLPVRDCSGNAGLAVSTDGGVTWIQHFVPNSPTQAHGSDPSIALGANNTVYFSYVASAANATEGHVHVQVSTDRGATWSKDVDIGATHGVKNAVFPEAVAGDDNRAAVGFLGTDRPGDYEALSFPGIWYLFIATTYDGGNTWNVVNATPNDPVQGGGGIWLEGGSHMNRNLADFNEVTMDDKGRVLFGYSDGCVGTCVGDPTTTSFTAHMRVARQSGGKPLLAAFDPSPAEPALPKPACLSGVRYSTGSQLTWKAPDNGGSDIVSYEIWRSTTAGTEVLIATTGTAKTTYNDTTADPAVPLYYYYVKAINTPGTGPQSNEINLPLSVLPPVESLCQLPGLTKLTDAAGDSLGGPGTDLLSFQLAQPYASDNVPKLAFTLNVDPAPAAVQPANSFTYVSMKIVNGAVTRYKGVRMLWSGPTPTFESYTPAAGNSGAVDGRFVTAGSQKPAEPSSSYDAPNGKVFIVVKASDLVLAPGDTIAGFVSGVAQDAVADSALYDQMPESLAYSNPYTLVSNNTCPPLLGIVSRKTHGTAGDKDIDLPLAGNPGIECRSGGANGYYKLVFTFPNNLTSVAGASVTGHNPASGTGTVSSSALGPNSNQYTVNLTGVSNAQYLTVTLNSVQDVAGNSSNVVSPQMGVLVGDVNASSAVDGNDVSAVQGQTRRPVNLSTFRYDVNGTGVIDGNDVSTTQSKTRTRLP